MNCNWTNNRTIDMKCLDNSDKSVLPDISKKFIIAEVV